MNATFDYLDAMRVEWEGTEAGLVPIVNSQRPGATLTYQETTLADLIEALSDEERFVRAHVLLTQLSGVEYRAFPAWNGLSVDIASDGTVTIEPNQRHRLANRWRQWYRSRPRPGMLPGDR